MADLAVAVPSQGAGSGSGAYLTYQDGKLVASRFLDPGRVTPDDALLQNVIFTAVGAGPAVTAGKAGVEAGWQGILTGSGETVLGPFQPTVGPSYIDVARAHGASYFDIGQEAWNVATETERLAANQHVLDIAIANRDRITLSVPFRMIRQDSYTGAEVRYLESHGYVRNGNTLIPQGLGSR